MGQGFIAVDWGTTSFRAYEVSAVGAIVRETADAAGILSVKDGAFDSVL